MKNLINLTKKPSLVGLELLNPPKEAPSAEILSRVSLVGLELLNPPKEKGITKKPLALENIPKYITTAKVDTYKAYAVEMEEAEKVRVENVKKAEEKKKKDEIAAQEKAKADKEADAQLLAIAQEKEEKFKKMIMYGGIGVGVVILGIVALSMFRRKQA
jgi:hypothetical protein